MKMKNLDGESLVQPPLSAVLGKPSRRHELRSWQLVLLIAACLALGAVIGSVAASSLSSKTDEEPKLRMIRALNEKPGKNLTEPETDDSMRLQIELCNKKSEKLQQKVEKLTEKSGLEKEVLKKEIDGMKEEMRQKDKSSELKEMNLKTEIDELLAKMRQKDKSSEPVENNLKKEIDEINKKMRQKDQFFEAEKDKLKEQIDQLRGDLVEKERLLQANIAELKTSEAKRGADQEKHYNERDVLVERVSICRSTVRSNQEEHQKEKDNLIEQMNQCNSTLRTTTKYLPWRTFGNCTYRNFDGRTNFTTAESVCQGFGGHLASIHSQDENQFIYELVHFHGLSPWIGLHSVAPGSGWQWTDKSFGKYRPWSGGEPDERLSSGIVGVVMWPQDKKWYDYVENENRPFVCKRCST